MANVITIDGPTSSGKSSVGHLFSQKIGYQFIDSGAIYRIGCLVALRENIDINSQENAAKIFENLNLEFKNRNGHTFIFLNGEDVTDILHTPQITDIVPVVAAYPKVRQIAKKIQRRLGEGQNTVMTGRDIGSEIFPNAKLKFFITAEVKVRAARRFKQLHKKDPNIKYADVLNGMIERDKHDSDREASPMRIPKNAIIIDTTNLTTEQSVEEMLKHYQKP